MPWFFALLYNCFQFPFQVADICLLLFLQGEKKIGENLPAEIPHLQGFCEDNMGSPRGGSGKEALPFAGKNVAAHGKCIALIRRLFQDREAGGMAVCGKFRKMPAIQRYFHPGKIATPFDILMIGHHVPNGFGRGR